MVKFLQNCSIRAKGLYSSKSGCILAKVVVLEQMCLYSGKSGCNRAKLLHLGQGGSNRAMSLYS